MYEKKTIQYDNIFTPNDYLKVKQSIYKNCVLIASLTSQKYDSINKRMKFVHVLAEQQLHDFSKNNIYKYIVMSNFVFSSSEDFINMLLNKGITYDDLNKFVLALTINKNKKNKEYHDALMSFASSIYKMTGVDDYNIIYNKISQVIAFEKELYNNLTLDKIK